MRLARLLGLVLLWPLALSAQTLVTCDLAGVTPCTTNPISNTGFGMPAWQAFGTLNADLIIAAPVFSSPGGSILGNAGGVPGAVTALTTLPFIVGVTRGGTGATLLSGPIKGNGTSAFTAASAADIYGLWTGTCSSSTFLRGDGSCAVVSGTGTVTTSGSPVSGNLAAFSGATSITNTDLSGDCTTSGTSALTCTKTSGSAFGTFATQNYATPPAIGGTTPAAGSFTTLSATGAVSGSGFNTLFGAPPAIGNVTPGTGKFTTVNGYTLTTGSSTLNFGGNFTSAGALTFSGAYGGTFTLTGTTAITFPTSGTLVNSGVTSLSSLATVGTIGTGVWQGTAVAPGYGGTGLASGISGGILGFTGTTTLASSALLTANALIVGGGAGATPSSLTGSGVPVLASGIVTVDTYVPAANGGCGVNVNPNADTSNMACGANPATITGNHNTLVGGSVGGTSSSGNDNTLTGFQSGVAMSNSSFNTAVGAFALASGTAITGGSNTALGVDALSGCGGACSSNIGVGVDAGSNISSGTNNIAIGPVAQSTLTTGTYNVVIGTSSAIDTPAANTNNYVTLDNVFTGYEVAPTVTSGAGTTPTIYAQGTAVFRIIEGATGTPSATLVLGMPSSPFNDWVCFVQDRTSSSITARQSGAASKTSVTVTFSTAPANSDVIQFTCGPSQ